MLNEYRPAQIDMAKMHNLCQPSPVCDHTSHSIGARRLETKQEAVDPANLRTFLRLPRLTSESAKLFLE
jgi:hypothetical protein